MLTFAERLLALKIRSQEIIASTQRMGDEREWVMTPEKYGVYMQKRQARTNALAIKNGHVTTSNASGKIRPLKPIAQRPVRKAQVTDGWVTGERERTMEALSHGACIEPDVRTEAERQFDWERDLIETRAFKVKESFRFKVGRTLMEVADGQRTRDAGRKRIWGLGQAEARILSELRAEYATVELDPRSDVELIRQRRIIENDEGQTRAEIREQVRRTSTVAELAHQREAEAEIMRDEAKVQWIADATATNREDLKKGLTRYFAEFNKDATYNGDSLFPMWVEVDGRWRLEAQPLKLVWNNELRKRGDEYKALWTLARMVDTRYEAQLKYRSKRKKDAYNRAA